MRTILICVLLSAPAWAAEPAADPLHDGQIAMEGVVEVALPDLTRTRERLVGSAVADLWAGAAGLLLTEGGEAEEHRDAWRAIVEGLESFRGSMDIAEAESGKHESAFAASAWFAPAGKATAAMAQLHRQGCLPDGGPSALLVPAAADDPMARIVREESVIRGHRQGDLPEDERPAAVDWDLRLSVDLGSLAKLFDGEDFADDAHPEFSRLFVRGIEALGRVHLLARVAGPVVEERWLFSAGPEVFGLAAVDRSLLERLPADTVQVFATGIATAPWEAPLAAAFLAVGDDDEDGPRGIDSISAQLREELGTDEAGFDFARLLREWHGTVLLAVVRAEGDDEDVKLITAVPRQRDLNALVEHYGNPDGQAALARGVVIRFGGEDRADGRDLFVGQDEHHWFLSNDIPLIEQMLGGEAGGFADGPLGREFATLGGDLLAVHLLGGDGQRALMKVYGMGAMGILGFQGLMAIGFLKEHLIDDARIDALTLRALEEGGMRAEASGMAGLNLSLVVAAGIVAGAAHIVPGLGAPPEGEADDDAEDPAAEGAPATP